MVLVCEIYVQANAVILPSFYVNFKYRNQLKHYIKVPGDMRSVCSLKSLDQFGSHFYDFKLSLLLRCWVSFSGPEPLRQRRNFSRGESLK